MTRERLGIRARTAVAAGRMARRILFSAFHQGAIQVPGRIALAIDPQLISHLRAKARSGSIVVTGTNGKTTTTGVIADALERAGMRVLCNREGANILPGVASALMAGPEADWAVIESDELYTARVLPQLQPDYLVLLNLFRDQLDRAGEIDRVQDAIVRALAASPGTALLVCADDPLSWSVALRAREEGTRVMTFGMGEDLKLPADRVPEARFCQLCGAELEYRHRSYAQLGSFSCPGCGFASPALDFEATDLQVGSKGISFSLGRPSMSRDDSPYDSSGRIGEVHADFGGVYMAYNLLAAAAALSLVGVELADLQDALDSYDPQNGRLQRFLVDGREVVLNLAKNPTGFNQNLSMLLTDERPKAVYVVINDAPNDGRDVSWLWDVDFERLEGQDDRLLVLAGGRRANDVQVRLKYAGIKASIVESVEHALHATETSAPGRPVYVLANYSALRPAKEALERMEGRHG